MKKNKMISIFLMLALLIGLTCASLSGCVNNEEKAKVYFVMKSNQTNFWKTAMVGANIAKSEYNIDLHYMYPSSEDDYKKQNELVKSAVDAGADAICLSAIDYVRTAEAVEYAYSKDVPVIMFDSFIDTNRKMVEIGTNNYEAGISSAKALIDTNNSYNVGIVNFNKDSQNAQQREKGFRDCVKDNEKIKIKSAVNVEANENHAMQATIKMIQENKDINAIVTFNEITTLGVSKAIKSMSREDIFVVGFDNNIMSINDLNSEEGYLDALIVQTPQAMGYLAVENAYKIIKGDKIKDYRIDTKTVLVTKENMFSDEIVKILFPIISTKI